MRILQVARLILFIATAISPALLHAQNSPDKALTGKERAVLYEEDPGNSEGARFTGSVTWRAELIQGSTEIRIVGDIEMPTRGISMAFRMQRNTDKSLPASHTIELKFSLDQRFPFQSISNVPGILMKDAEKARGAPLDGLTVKVKRDMFLIGLSSASKEFARNLVLLRSRSWIDLPIVYGNGRRAILAFSKGGTVGQEVFGQGFAAWDLPYYGFKEQCEKLGRPTIGMDRREVEATCWGKPISTERTTTAEGTKERMLFPRGSFLLFENDKLTAISERD